MRRPAVAATMLGGGRFAPLRLADPGLLHLEPPAPGRTLRDGEARLVAGVRVSHVGICVSDLERSERFYCDGLGFEPAGSHHVGAEFARLMELPGVDLRSRFVRRDGLSLELLGFEHPTPAGDGGRRPMNALGFTHLSLRVDDVEAAAGAVEAHGGRCWWETRTTLELGDEVLDFVYCTDPDGVRVELMSLPGPG